MEHCWRIKLKSMQDMFYFYDLGKARKQVVEHSTYSSKIVGSNHATSTRREKIARKNKCDNCCSSLGYY